MTIEVYKTNVNDTSKAKTILDEIRKNLPESDPSFDLEDQDKVLRVECSNSETDGTIIEKILGRYGYKIEMLP